MAKHTNTQIILITGTGTDVGKTVVAGTFVAGLGADYWKPLQTGTGSGTDSAWITKHALQPNAKVLPEAYALAPPEAPLIAAKRMNQIIDLAHLTVPNTQNNYLVIEGAGGLLVPITENYTYLDWFVSLNQPIVLVAALYLGVINHCLLSVAALQAHKANIAGIVFVEQKKYDGQDARNYINQKSNVPDLGILPYLYELNPDILKKVFATYIRWQH